MRRLGTRHAPEVPNDHTNLTSTASDEHMRALVPHMRTQHAPSTGTTGWQRMDQAQTPDPYRENPPENEFDHVVVAGRSLCPQRLQRLPFRTYFCTKTIKF